MVHSFQNLAGKLVAQELGKTLKDFEDVIQPESFEGLLLELKSPNNLLNDAKRSRVSKFINVHQEIFITVVKLYNLGY